MPHAIAFRPDPRQLAPIVCAVAFWACPALAWDTDRMHGDGVATAEAHMARAQLARAQLTRAQRAKAQATEAQTVAAAPERQARRTADHHVAGVLLMYDALILGALLVARRYNRALARQARHAKPGAAARASHAETTTTAAAHDAAQPCTVCDTPVAAGVPCTACGALHLSASDASAYRDRVWAMDIAAVRALVAPISSGLCCADCGSSMQPAVIEHHAVDVCLGCGALFFESPHDVFHKPPPETRAHHAKRAQGRRVWPKPTATGAAHRA